MALLAYNLDEVRAQVALRALVISLAGSALLFLLLWLLLRHPARAALLTSLLVLLFFSYGHLVQALTKGAKLSANPKPALLLGLLFLALVGLWTWLLLKKIGDFQRFTVLFNLIGAVLLVFPLFRILEWYTSSGLPLTGSAHAASLSPLSLEATLTPPAAGLPDVYFIVLDMYTRGDALKDDFGYDNTPFLDGLRDLGFAVIDCSHSNYDYTMQSVSSTLNMDYLTSLREQLGVSLLKEQLFGRIIQHSRVRDYLEGLGYKTVAFETGFKWSELTDASVYLGPGEEPIQIQSIDPFESMLAKSTALLPLIEANGSASRGLLQGVDFPFADHIRRQLSLLDQLPQVARMPGPTFAFVHILIPHLPLIFRADGTIRTDPAYFSAPNSNPVDNAHLVPGYIEQVQYINSRILPILKEILAQPGTPPIIVMEGDHGFTDTNRYKNLSTYYVDAKTRQMLYPGISPINSFRVIFNSYFGTNFPLLPDNSYPATDIGRQIPEEAYRCAKP